MAKANPPAHSGCNWEKILREPKAVQKLIRALMPILKARATEFDGFVVCGYSMSLLAPILAYLLEKSIVVVTKKGDLRHTVDKVEGIHGQRLLMVDDLISSGETLRHVANSVQDIAGQLAGLVLWWQETGPSFTYKNDTTNQFVEVPVWHSKCYDKLM